MPTAGTFRKGDRAMTPGMRTGTVTKVSRDGQRVTIAYDETFRGEQTFHANALHYLPLTREERA